MKICLDCSEVLCQSCSLGRHSHPTLQEHRVIDYGTGDDEASKLFQMICELSSCDDHPGCPISYYCRDHDIYGCEHCIVRKHNQCRDVLKANSIDVAEVTESELKSLQASAKNISDYAKTMTETRTANANSIREQVDDITNTLKAMRIKVDQVFDAYMDKTTRIAVSAAEKHKAAASRDIQILKDTDNSVTLSMTLLEKIVSFGSRSQRDIIVRRIRDRITIYEDTLLTMSETFKEVDVGLKQEDMLIKLINPANNTFQELGMVTETEKHTAVPPYQSQHLLRRSKLTKVKTVTVSIGIKQPRYSGITFLRNHQIILIEDLNGKCIKLNPNGGVAGVLDLASQGPASESTASVNELLRMAGKRDTVVAVPRPYDKKIILLSTDEGLTVKAEINLLCKPKVLHVLRNGNIAAALVEPVAFGIISMGEVLVEIKTYFCGDTSGRKFLSFDHMAVDERRCHVIQPCTQERAVSCFDFEGNPKFRYNCKSCPQTVALDGTFNIYVCMGGLYQSALAIHVISPGGKGLRIIKDSESYSNILSIAFNNSGDEFAVTEGNKQTITVFKLEKDE